MSDEVRVEVAQLRAGLAQLLDEVERRHGDCVDLGADYYWTVYLNAAYRFDTTDDPQITVGQLSDDVASLRELLEAGEERPVVLWHDLSHVVGILARIAAVDAPA
ncbi:hypothetical protein JQS43_08110 [Natronosporangium hydrolyticum]|uniref:Uncharacterized protein n=1 Tax=Natronosporangium hydrolyticum TaxID=2811111 RepID=A0A895YJQ9_9ACTN|nr:hypothetical protein [Natronosporangium hydrolyticum]QSB16245.1 hypothetical protein JQS43_08110 [Natronosporangium hydrolyticum]